jgi:hypothetical protein
VLIFLITMVMVDKNKGLIKETVLRASDDQLTSWTKPAFDNEEQRAADTEQRIRDAVVNDTILKNLPVRVFAKGSSKNNTNVRRHSDIDIAVEYTGMIQTDFAQGLDFSHSGLIPYSQSALAHVTLPVFKQSVGRALVGAFGNSVVDATGNKVFKIRGSSKIFPADVVPCTTYHFYDEPRSPRRGIELILNQPNGIRHFNYPKQHEINGISKNNATGKRYKSIVRILKNTNEHLKANGIKENYASHMIESLAYNVENSVYLIGAPWRPLVQNVLLAMFSYLTDPEPTNPNLRWTEANGHKWLFYPGQTWDRQHAINFTVNAWGVIK